MIRQPHVVLRLLLPLALAGAQGCLASKGDIRLLQDQLTSVQQSIARSDSMHLARMDATSQLMLRTSDSLRVLSDSLRLLSTRFSGFQAKSTSELYTMGQQLIAIQELTGQTQKRLQEFRATLEQQKEQAAALSGDSTGEVVPGPDVLFQGASAQFQRGSYATARSAFQDLLTRYPNYEQAPYAQLFVGEAYDAEQNHAAADSAYQLVLSKYPNSGEPAATALYKYAQSQLAQSHPEVARVALNRILRDYPSSEAAALARNLLSTIK